MLLFRRRRGRAFHPEQNRYRVNGEGDALQDQDAGKDPDEGLQREDQWQAGALRRALMNLPGLHDVVGGGQQGRHRYRQQQHADPDQIDPGTRPLGG